jgi:plastocyanin
VGAAIALGALLLAPALSAATLSGHVEIAEEVNGSLTRLKDQSNAVIFVAGFVETPDPARHSELIQKNKSFSERVLPITVGESVAFPNEDPIYHNVWSKSRARSFDLGLYKFPQSKEVQFPAPGLVTVFCNIHPQMISTILVLPNNKFVVTGPTGEYKVDGIPDGQFPVYAWVEGAAPIRQMVTFSEGKPVRLDFRLVLKRIPLHHLNKEGKPYEKY